ncbi:MAG: GntR family transcriptional regulator [Mangrovicoccus sp.]
MKSLPERIADQLRREILRGTFLPGAPIKEREHTATMGVSRTPMREALRILANEGLLTLRPARSPIVANPDLQEVTDALEVLMALEVAAAELACHRASSDELAEIDYLNKRMVELADRIDNLDLFDIDMGFHKAVVRAAHNEALAKSHESFTKRMWRIRYLSASRADRREDTFAEHQGISNGLLIRDTKLAKHFVRLHFASLLANIREKFLGPGARPQALNPRITLGV